MTAGSILLWFLGKTSGQICTWLRMEVSSGGSLILTNRSIQAKRSSASFPLSFRVRWSLSFVRGQKSSFTMPQPFSAQQRYASMPLNKKRHPDASGAGAYGR